MKYVTVDDVQRYEKMLSRLPKTPEELASFANWFAEGAVTSLSNHIMEKFEESSSSARLEYGIARTCRCLSCYEFQILNEENEVIDSAESLTDWVKR